MKRRNFLKTTVAAPLLMGLNIADGAESMLPRFAVISDIHFSGGNNGCVQKVSRTLKNFIAKGNLDAIFVVGDLTNNGQAAQYRQLVSVFGDKDVVPESQRVVYMMGNHEYYNKENNGDSTKNYTDFCKQPLHQFIDVKGFPFITVSINGGGENSYNADSQKFLSDKLAEAAAKYPDKPIFCFAHIPPRNTCYGSKSWGTANFYPFLHEYPQTVFFSGHTHTPIGDPRMIWQDTFTSINDGSVAYACLEQNEVDAGKGGYLPGNEQPGNVQEGFIVNVKSSEVFEIERWDAVRNEEILPRWNVNWKNKNYAKRDGKPAPKFAVDAKPTVVADGTSYTVSFPQATDNENVFRYLVELKDGDKTVASYRKFSVFYLNSETPKTLSVKFEKLPEGKELTASVTALDSFDNRSESIES
ncbi:MAG: metallophosphoesterase [Planctomycetaceae bacterium]|jgi:predicted phosphodiesterase|nr:metallophosphoesterase [Planctomycetaceae bacterium]